MWGASKYRRGYTGRDYHVTGGHEKEALDAQRARKPSHVGMFVLRILGYRGAAPGRSPRGESTPRHERKAR